MNINLLPEQKENICVVSGFAHPDLGFKVAHAMSVPLAPLEQKMFPNTELYGRFEETVRGKQVFIVQSHQAGSREINGEETPFSINDAIVEQALLVQAAATSSAKEVTAVIPFLGYSRQDRKSQGREPISVMFTLGTLAAMGAHRIVAVDMHSPQTQLAFNGDGRQFDHLTAQPLLLDHVRSEIASYSPEECVVVSPDAGATKLAQTQQEKLGIDLVHLAKKRKRGQSHTITRDEKIADVDGKVCIIFDDMIDTAGTITSAAQALNSSGAKAIFVVATHGIFSGQALKRLTDSPIDKVLVTDTVPMDKARKVLGNKLRVAEVAPIIGQALIEISIDGSVSRLFQDQNHM